MKKYSICLLAAILVLTSSAFTNAPHKKHQSKKFNNYVWYDYNGGLLQMCDPNWYSLDPNNFPECPSTLGLIYCEVKCLPSEDDNSHPDLGNMIEARFRPLL